MYALIEPLNKNSLRFWGRILRSLVVSFEIILSLMHVYLISCIGIDIWIVHCLEHGEFHLLVIPPLALSHDVKMVSRIGLCEMQLPHDYLLYGHRLQVQIHSEFGSKLIIFFEIPQDILCGASPCVLVVLLVMVWPPFNINSCRLSFFLTWPYTHLMGIWNASTLTLPFKSLNWM